MAALLTTNEAADLLRVPINTLYYWRHRGEGPPSFRLGRRVLYDADALEDWVDQRRQSRRPQTSGQLLHGVSPTTLPSDAQGAPS